MQALARRSFLGTLVGMAGLPALWPNQVQPDKPSPGQFSPDGIELCEYCGLPLYDRPPDKPPTNLGPNESWANWGRTMTHTTIGLTVADGSVVTTCMEMLGRAMERAVPTKRVRP